MDAYAWTDDEPAVTVAYVHGSSVCGVGDVLGFRWDTEREASWREASEQAMYTAETAWTVQVDELDGWLVTIEPNGLAAARQDAVTSLSRGGTAVSVFWNVNRVMRFVLARDGVLKRSFDPLLYAVVPVGEPLPDEDGLPFGLPGARPERAALQLAERLTGVRLGADWLVGTPRRTWTTRPEFPEDEATARERIRRRDDDLRRYRSLARPGDPELRSYD